MSSFQAEFQLLLNAVNYSTIVAEVSLSGFVLLIYDFILSFPEELKFVWRSRWSLGKVLFLLNRYLVPLDLAVELVSFMSTTPSDNFCKKWFITDTVLVWFELAVIQALLVMRTAALWNGNKYVMALLATTYLGTMAAILWVVIRVTRDVTIIAERPVPQLLGCLFAAEKDVTSGIWLAPLTVETVIFLLTSLKAFQHWQNKLLSRTHLVTILYRDGFLYFVVMFAMNILNTLIFYLLPLQLSEVTFILYRALMSVMASRLLLNVRAALLEPQTATASGGLVVSISQTVHTHTAQPAQYVRMGSLNGTRSKRPDSIQTQSFSSDIKHSPDSPPFAKRNSPPVPPIVHRSAAHALSQLSPPDTDEHFVRSYDLESASDSRPGSEIWRRMDDESIHARDD
ncbi:hypothetical protein SISSUDRAFT_1034864 [Sistotremastrum suecicum HHB10207 ss-3]|uniref:DUF6533 domain-containing protein n=1 Tax=Sistotremastrum suecicum HHB10207 ss-3 TaxID=1314776 RepID=A0A166BI28_9AGAM|nr:hypothetical protein SISSUDRAFT_1034864 [Sistotremastrum suecicum HHB10207 ss-3]